MSAMLSRSAAALALGVLVPLAAGCAAIERYSGTVAGAVGVAGIASELDLLSPEYLAGGLIAYAIFDPLAPNWEITAQRLDDERVRFDLRMKRLVSGGEGEARAVFARSAQRYADAQGAAAYDVIRFEEGIESSRPFARRVASGEVRLAHSRIWPSL